MKDSLLPTVEQLTLFYIQCVRISNLLQSIEMVRYDIRTKRIVILVGDETQLEILENGEVIIE